MFSKIARHWATCRRFESNADRLWYVYGRLLRRIPWGLPGRDALVQVRLRGHQSPFSVRLSSTDWLVLEEIFHQGEYTQVGRHLKGARFIVDLGANAGFSVRYWQALFPEARFIAVEPDAANCEACERNLSAGALRGQVQLVQAAVGPHAGRGELLHSGGEWAYRVRVGSERCGVPVEVISMRELLEEHAADCAIDLLKCDIEGAERELFADCRGWIERVRSLVIELHPPYAIADLLDALDRAGGDFRLVEVSTRKACPVAYLCRNQTTTHGRSSPWTGAVPSGASSARQPENHFVPER